MAPNSRKPLAPCPLYIAWLPNPSEGVSAGMKWTRCVPRHHQYKANRLGQQLPLMPLIPLLPLIQHTRYSSITGFIESNQREVGALATKWLSLVSSCAAIIVKTFFFPAPTTLYLLLRPRPFPRPCPLRAVKHAAQLSCGLSRLLLRLGTWLQVTRQTATVGTCYLWSVQDPENAISKTIEMWCMCLLINRQLIPVGRVSAQEHEQ